MQENALLSVIVPCYNEADNLPLFYQHILPVCRSLCEQGSISDYEILLVNDGSKDRTLPTMRALSEQDPHVFSSPLPEISARRPPCWRGSLTVAATL